MDIITLLFFDQKGFMMILSLILIQFKRVNWDQIFLKTHFLQSFCLFLNFYICPLPQSFNQYFWQNITNQKLIHVILSEIIIIEIDGMQGSSELQTCLQDFKRMLQKNCIPLKMVRKLQYLQSTIMNLQREKDIIDDLPQFQKLSLKQMNRDTQISLFISIVKCLSGKEIVQYFTNQKSTLRKEQTFSGWNSCFMSCDSNRIIVFKKVDDKHPWHEFLIQKLWISKIYRQHKKQYIFGIAYERHKYQVGFEDEATCARIHGIVINLIRQRRILREKLKEITVSQSNISEGTTELQFQKEEGIFQHDFDQEDYIEFEEREYLSHIQQKVLQLELFDNSTYELVKNIDKGRILENKSQNSFKICLLLERLTIDSLLQKFIELPQWNSQVQTFKIVNRIRSNTFLAYIKLKKYSMLTYPRQANLTVTYIKTCQCLTSPEEKQENPNLQFGKHYLIFNTMESEENSSNLTTVKMNFEQVVEFSVVEDSPNTIFIIIYSKIDFKGYDYFNYNREMNLQFLNDFAHFITYCRQRSTNEVKCSTFDLNYCACKIKKMRKNSVHSEISIPYIKQQQSQRNKSSEKHVFKHLNVVSAIEDYHNGIKNQDLIEIIRKGIFQSYYFKHRFSESIQNNEYKQSNYTYKHVKDFLLQDGKWKISNNGLIFCDEQAIKLQKGVLKLILKQIGSNILAGKSIMNMSLPVEIFDKVSILEMLASRLGFFPRFINDAINTTNLVEQMKFVVISFIFQAPCFPNAVKPFNPILGQTFQGWLGGIPIYFQQISHHPPISTMYMKTADFEAYGNFDLQIDMGFNTAYSKVSSIFTIKIFKTKTQYMIKLADVEMGGLSFGQRTMKLTGRAFVYEKTNDIYCEYSASKDKKKVYEYSHKMKPNDLGGGIFKVTNSFGKKLLTMDRSKAFQGVKFDEIIEKYCHISGTWYGDIFFDNVPYKTFENGPFPLRVERPVYLLPSDSLFRTDIIYKKWNQNGKSNHQKQNLQNLQRKDRKMRQALKRD